MKYSNNSSLVFRSLKLDAGRHLRVPFLPRGIPLLFKECAIQFGVGNQAIYRKP